MALKIPDGLILHWFADSPDAGSPDCKCSVCLHLIPEGFVLRLFDTETNLEARFCTECAQKHLGIKVYEDPMDTDAFMDMGDGDIGDGYMDDDSPDLSEGERLEQAMAECGRIGGRGACLMAGTEYCDFECPLRDG